MNPYALFKAAVFATVVCSATLADAADLTLRWDPPASASVAGYIVLYGSSPGAYSQQFNAGNSTSYTITNLTDGYTYFFAVRSYDAAGTMSALSSELAATIPSSIPAAVTSLTVTSSKASPQALGNTVNWIATISGGVPPYQYQWSLYHGGSWSSAAWSPASTWSWTPSAAGNDYQIQVAVRSSWDTSATGELAQSVPFIISAPPVSSATLSSTMPSPQKPGTTIVWSAKGNGGVAPYEYKWWLSDGSTWTAMTNWTSGATWSWTPAVDDTYSVRVWIRSAGNFNDAPEALTSVTFVIQTDRIPGKGHGHGNRTITGYAKKK